MEHRTNYFIGEEENWRTEIANYRQVRFEGVYEGIDLVWHGRERGGVQYDFEVAAGASPERIEWEIKGAEKVELDGEGNLIISTRDGEIRQEKPFTYQEENGLRGEVESGFEIREEKDSVGGVRVGFRLGEYDRTKPLVIDPLAYSTFLGGSIDEEGYGIAIDSAGNVYVTGYTESTDFPTTSGTYDTTHNGFYDVFVTKLNATGSSLLYSTFIGGNDFDFGYGIAVDSSGNAFVTGETFDSTTDYPTTTGAYDTTHNGSNDVFVTKLNAAGSGLLYSTFIGGSGGDGGYGIAIDSSGNAFVTGYTQDGTTDYPTTPGAFDTTHNGNYDVFVTKLNAAGSGLLYSTFIGGSSNDEGRRIAIDSSGNAFVTGLTVDGTIDYPTTTGAYDTTHNGFFDVFVTKLNAAGSALLYSTFIGGDNIDVGRGIAVDSAGNAFVTGETFDSTTDYPTTTGAFDTTHNGFYDVFVTKLDLAPTSAQVSIGGRVFDENGYGVRGAIVTLTQADGTTLTYRTSTFGYYRFDDVEVGQTVVVMAQAKGQFYNPQIILVSEELTNLDFVPISPVLLE
jgi:hypothetical protein